MCETATGPGRQVRWFREDPQLFCSSLVHAWAVHQPLQPLLPQHSRGTDPTKPGGDAVCSWRISLLQDTVLSGPECTQQFSLVQLLGHVLNERVGSYTWAGDPNCSHQEHGREIKTSEAVPHLSCTNQTHCFQIWAVSPPLAGLLWFLINLLRPPPPALAPCWNNRLGESPALLPQHAPWKVRTQDTEHAGAWCSRPVGFGMSAWLPLFDHRHLRDLWPQ